MGRGYGGRAAAASLRARCNAFPPSICLESVQLRANRRNCRRFCRKIAGRVGKLPPKRPNWGRKRRPNGRNLAKNTEMDPERTLFGRKTARNRPFFRNLAFLEGFGRQNDAFLVRKTGIPTDRKDGGRVKNLPCRRNTRDPEYPSPDSRRTRRKNRRGGPLLAWREAPRRAILLGHGPEERPSARRRPSQTPFCRFSNRNFAFASDVEPDFTTFFDEGTEFPRERHATSACFPDVLFRE